MAAKGTAQPADGSRRRRRWSRPPLEVWLTARWGAHTRKAGRTWWMPNEHGAWPLRSAEILELDDELVSAAGVEPAGDPMRALFSPGVHARFGRPTQVKL